MPDVTARIDIPTRTIVKVVLVLATLWFLARIGPVLLQLFGGLLLAMTLYPPVVRLQARGYSKGRAIVTVFGVFVAGLSIVLAVLIPRLIEDGQTFWENLPGYIEDGTGWLDERAPWIVDRLNAWAQSQQGDIELANDVDDVPSGTGGDQSTGPSDVTAEGEIAAQADGGIFDVRT